MSEAYDIPVSLPADLARILDEEEGRDPLRSHADQVRRAARLAAPRSLPTPGDMP